MSTTAYVHIGRLNNPAPSDMSTRISLHWSPLKGSVHLEHSMYKEHSTEFSTRQTSKKLPVKAPQFSDRIVVMLQSPSKYKAKGFGSSVLL